MEYGYNERQCCSRFSPSNRSAFTRLPALQDGTEEDEPGGRASFSRQRLFDVASSGGDGGASVCRHPLPPAILSPVEALWERQRSLAERSTLAETDEETGQEDEEAVERFRERRSSLPVHPLAQIHCGPGRWDFKPRAIPFSNLPVGRVSPLMSDHEHGGGGGGGRAVGKKLAAHKALDELGGNRASTGTPPDKTSSVAGELGSQSLQTTEDTRQSSDSAGKGDEEEEGREAEESVSEGEEESEREAATDLHQSWEDGAEDVENGAKAVHMEDPRHPTPPLPLLPASVLPRFHSASPAKGTSSTSTPNSLSRPKHAMAPRAKQRAPSVPALPTTFLASSTDPASLPGLPECLGEYERTLHNARNYMREFKALAESGSSDPESDPEPSLNTRLKAVELMKQISSAAKVPALIDHHLVTLHKENKETDLGFSLSDGFGEPGVYVKSIHSNGLAERGGELHLFDRIMKV